jgi:hypothetical protein
MNGAMGWRAGMQSQSSKIEMVEVTDPVENAKARKRREQFDRNIAWLHAHGQDIYPKHRGKCICIAGEELFVGDRDIVKSCGPTLIRRRPS